MTSSLTLINIKGYTFNPFVSNAPFLFPLKTSRFQGVENGNEWVNYFFRIPGSIKIKLGQIMMDLMTKNFNLF